MQEKLWKQQRRTFSKKRKIPDHLVSEKLKLFIKIYVIHNNNTAMPMLCSLCIFGLFISPLFSFYIFALHKLKCITTEIPF